LQTETERLLSHFSLAYSSKQFRVETKDTCIDEFSTLLGKTDNRYAFVVVNC